MALIGMTRSHQVYLMTNCMAEVGKIFLRVWLGMTSFMGKKKMTRFMEAMVMTSFMAKKITTTSTEVQAMISLMVV